VVFLGEQVDWVPISRTARTGALLLVLPWSKLDFLPSTLLGSCRNASTLLGLPCAVLPIIRVDYCLTTVLPRLVYGVKTLETYLSCKRG
jgi:hypothetical protein